MLEGSPAMARRYLIIKHPARVLGQPSCHNESPRARRRRRWLPYRSGTGSTSCAGRAGFERGQARRAIQQKPRGREAARGCGGSHGGHPRGARAGEPRAGCPRRSARPSWRTIVRSPPSTAPREPGAPRWYRATRGGGAMAAARRSGTLIIGIVSRSCFAAPSAYCPQR